MIDLRIRQHPHWGMMRKQGKRESLRVHTESDIRAM